MSALFNVSIACGEGKKLLDLQDRDSRVDSHRNPLGQVGLLGYVDVGPGCADDAPEVRLVDRVVVDGDDRSDAVVG